MKLDLNILQLQIVYSIDKYLDIDLILCLCSNNIIMINAQSFEVILNFEMASPSQKIYIEILDNKYKFCVVHKYSISIYELIRVYNNSNINTSSNSTYNSNLNSKNIKLNKISEINSTELITNKNILYSNNLIIFETKNKINIFKIDYYTLALKSFSVKKNQNQKLQNIIIKTAIIKKELTIHEKILFISNPFIFKLLNGSLKKTRENLNNIIIELENALNK